jgi:aspartate/methionine/tyrosine aminotransferase
LARSARHRDLAVDRLRQIDGVQVPVPDGAFYVFPRLEGLRDSIALCESLVRERRVGVAPGSAFGAGGEGHVRICFAVDESTLLEGLDRFEAGWRASRDRGPSA